MRLDVVVAPREGALAAQVAARLSAQIHRFKLLVVGSDNGASSKVSLNGEAALITAGALPILEQSGLRASGTTRSSVPILALLDPNRPADMLELPEDVAGIILIDHEFDQLGDIVDLAREGYTVLPRHLTLGVLELRFRRMLLTELSPVESRVFHLIGVGRTNKEIADELGLSEMAVKSLVRAALRKLRFRNRTEAAVFASRLAAITEGNEMCQAGGELHGGEISAVH